VRAAGYHAGLAADERASAQHRFMEGDADVVVATNAFGMGVDKADVRSVIHWAIPKSVESYYQEAGRGGRDGLPARAILLAMRADLGRLINFIERDGVDAGEVLAYVRRLGGSCGAGPAVVDAPIADKDRVCLGVAERAGLCTLEPAARGRLEVSFTGAPNAGRVAQLCKANRDRGWRAYRAVEAFASQTGKCRRRALLDHFGDRRPGAPLGRCCAVCDPGSADLPDPAALIAPKAARPRAAAPTAPPDEPLLAALKQWRLRASDGKPAFTVAHNTTLETIAALKPSSLDELAAVRGVGPAFVKRHGAQVLSLVASG
jgi:ATP-dependent DNA helicase RecQ